MHSLGWQPHLNLNLGSSNCKSLSIVDNMTLPGPQFPHLPNGHNKISYFKEFGWGFTKLMHKIRKRHIAHNENSMNPITIIIYATPGNNINQLVLDIVTKDCMFYNRFVFVCFHVCCFWVLWHWRGVDMLPLLGFARDVGQPKDSRKVQMQGHMKKEAAEVGKEYIMKGENSSRPVLGRMSCCSKYPWKSLQGPSLSEHFLHIYRKGSNHPFHFILTTSKLCLPGYLHDHPFHLPKN